MRAWVENSIAVVDDKWDATGGFVYLSAIYLEIEEREAKQRDGITRGLCSKGPHKYDIHKILNVCSLLATAHTQMSFISMPFGDHPNPPHYKRPMSIAQMAPSKDTCRIDRPLRHTLQLTRFVQRPLSVASHR